MIEPGIHIEDLTAAAVALQDTAGPGDVGICKCIYALQEHMELDDHA